MKQTKATAEQSLILSYTLTYDEAFDSFLLLTARGNPKVRRVLSVILLVLAGVLIVFYGLNPYNLEYFVLPLLVLATFGGLTYYPKAKAAMGAKKVAAQKGSYKIEFFTDGHIKSFQGQKLPLSNDKDARAFETDALFVIRPDSMNTFCLPKRAMKNEEIPLVRHTLETHVKKFQVRLSS